MKRNQVRVPSLIHLGVEPCVRAHRIRRPRTGRERFRDGFGQVNTTNWVKFVTEQRKITHTFLGRYKRISILKL